MSLLTERYRERMARTVGRRGDLYQATYAAADANTARLLIGFEPSLGAPKTAEVEDFVTATYGGKLAAVVETLRIYDAEGAASVVVRREVPTVALRQAQQHNLVAVSPMLYKSAAAGDESVWDVRQSEAGPQLVRREADDISALMQERSSRMAYRQGRVNFERLVTAGRSDLAAGDEVMFYADGMCMSGTVSSAGDGDMATVSAEGKSYKVAKSLIEVTKKGAASRSKMEAKTRDYFRQEFAAKPELGTQISKTTPPKPGETNAPAKLSRTAEGEGDEKKEEGEGEKKEGSRVSVLTAFREAAQHPRNRVPEKRASIREALFGPARGFSNRGIGR